MSSKLSQSKSEYQIRCRDYIQRALKRPSMYYRSLQDFEAMLLGYSLAHVELGLISQCDSFDVCFCEWLKQETDVPIQSGWALAIERLSPNHISMQRTFEKFVLEFLDQWSDASNAT